jgi:predicted O-methyltransferase YrrM
MSTPFGHDDTIKIDRAHADLLTGLIKSSKPKTILELGIGGGQATDAILSGLDYNQQKYQYVLVDNWLDFDGVMPSVVGETYGSRVNIVTSGEREFVFSCNEKFDFIMSDADHHHTQEWFKYVYDTLLADDGILIYHDVTLTSQFPNLIQILYRCQEFNLKHKLFNQDSLPGEMCFRGLLVIFK